MFQYNRANIMIKPLAEWMEFNPVLAYGELVGVETEDKVRFKLGNGIDAFSTILFVDDEILGTLENKVDGTFTSEDAGKVLGVDEQGNVVPMTSIPSDLGDVIPRLTEVEADVDTLASNVTTEVARIDADIVGTNDYIAEVDEALEGAVERLDAMEGEVALLAEAGVATDGALVTLQSDVEVMRGNVTDAMTAVNLATARVDNLINELSANPEYTPAAEVVDMRTGYDGIVHPTAGAALRSVGEDLLAIREEMQTIDPDDLGLEQDELTMLVYPTFKGVRSINGIPLAGGTGGGGTGGGGGATTIIKLRNTTGSNNFTVSTGNPAVIYYVFSSVDSDDGTATGNGTASYYINEELVASLSIEQGDNSFDTAPYLKSGDNSIRLTVVDVDGNSRSLYWNITVIQIRIESNFDYTLAYPGTVTFKYTAIGDAEKTIHFILDGVAQETTTVLASNKLNTRTFENLNHGLHTLEVYATAMVNGNTVTSNKLNYDVIVTRENSLDPIISINYNVKSLLQGELVDIPYIVYDPLSTESIITLEILHVVDGVLTPYRTETRVVGNNLQHWTTRHYPLGDVTFRVSLRDLSRSVTINVTELKLPVEPVTNDLELHLSAAGRSNSEVNPAIWEYNGITTTFNNVNWSSSGWINDEQGDTALHLTGGSSATINFKPFDNDIRIYGKTLEFEFAVRDVNNRDAKVITCKSGTIGIDITADKAVMSSNANSVQCHFGDNRKIRVSFTVESTSEGKLMSVYLDGVLTNVCQYDTDSFQQRPAVAIDIGSPYCSVDIYNIRIYSTALTHTEVIGNYMCDVPNIVERAEIYDSNDIYDDAGNLLLSKVKTKIPVMTIHGPLPQSKGDKKDVEISYVDPFDHSMDFDYRYCKIDVQGTSSQFYVRKNYKLKFNEKFAHIKGHIETKVYCCKADYAEATSTHNTGNANIAHTLYSDKIPPQEVDERCRTTIEGFPIVIFHQEDSEKEPYFLGKYSLPK